MNLEYGEIGFRSAPKEELTTVTKKNLKKSPVYFWSPQELQVIGENASAEDTVMATKGVRVGG